MPHELMGFWLSGPGADAGTGGQAGTDEGADGGGAHAAATRRSVAVTGIAPSSLIGHVEDPSPVQRSRW